jgi:hypothetical protein
MEVQFRVSGFWFQKLNAGGTTGSLGASKGSSTQLQVLKPETGNSKLP